MRSELQFARERLAPESGADIESCRTDLTARFERCALTCDSCAAECTSAAARNLVSAWRCSFGMPVLGIMAAMQVTDQGVEIANRWGAERTRGYIATPDDAWTEQFRTLVQNSVDRPRIARGAISCRKAHRESSTGGFVPTLDDEGKHIARTGFMVGCNTDLDCYSRCGGVRACVLCHPRKLPPTLVSRARGRTPTFRKPLCVHAQPSVLHPRRRQSRRV